MPLGNSTNRREYLLKELVFSGLGSSVAFVALVLGMALYASIAFKGSQLLTIDSFVARSAAGITAFILAVAIVYRSNRVVSKYLPYWLAIPLLGSVILVVSVVGILIVGRIIEDRIPRDPEVLFPQPDVFPLLPTISDLVFLSVITFTATFTASALASFVVHTLRFRIKSHKKEVRR